MIAVLHAYSRANAGDGLLVDLTIDRLERAGVARSAIVVVAMDPESFPEFRTVGIGTPDRAANARTAAAALTATSIAGLGRLAPGKTAHALRDADAFVAVGGGYLRAGTRTNRIGTAINHLPQLRMAARSGKPTVYLPQSIGPLEGRVGAAVQKALSRLSQVHVRDDRSRDDLAGLRNVHRTPDLAVLAVAEQVADAQPRPLSSTGAPILVARALVAPGEYEQLLRDLNDQLDGRWAVQAGGATSKSDAVFYDSLGVRPMGSVGKALLEQPSPVVSVRLHGAVQAILSGVPAIHLAYERKSWGAYEDLGLIEWLHSARSFEPGAVAAQVRELQSDPAPFWEALRARTAELRAASERLDRSLRRVLSG